MKVFSAVLMSHCRMATTFEVCVLLWSFLYATQPGTRHAATLQLTKKVRSLRSKSLGIYTYQLNVEFDKAIQELKTASSKFSIKYEGKVACHMKSTGWVAVFSSGKSGFIALYPGRYIEPSFFGTAITNGDTHRTTIEIVDFDTFAFPKRRVYKLLFKTCHWGLKLPS